MSNTQAKPKVNVSANCALRILLVDDQKFAQHKLQQMLSSEGDLQIVGIASNGEEAISNVESLKPDLVLIDIEMPKMNGIEATEIISRRFPDCKILVLSSHEHQEYVQKTISVGADGYILKSTSTEDLVSAIRLVSRGYSHFNSQLFKKIQLARNVNDSSGVYRPKSIKPHNARRIIYWLVGIAAAGFLATATTVYFTQQSKVSKLNISESTVGVTSEDLNVQIEANGVVQPVRKTNLSPREEGQIARMYVNEGDKVKRGQLIASMDSKQIKAQVNQYKAELARANADLVQKRTGNRPQEIAIAQAEVVKNEALVTEARSRLALASKRVKSKRYATQQGAISRDDLDEVLTEERNARDNFKQSEASLAVAKQELMLQSQGYRQEEITQSEEEVAQAKAQLQFYQTQLENTFIRAPFAGVITQQFAQEGDFVTPTTSASTSDGATSTSIAEVSSGLEVDAEVPEASIERIKLGQEVEIYSDAYPDDIFKGSVRLIAPRAMKEGNNATFFSVKVTLQTGQDKLKLGMNVNLKFKGDSIRNALVVPLAAVITKEDGQTGVLVLDENKQAKFRPVTIGSPDGNKVQVIEGVSQGERILITPPEGQVIPGVDSTEF